ncbi:MAG: glycosyltransferase family 2 protein [Christensenellales bacterium]
MKNIKISILMPTYNDDKTITETFDSVINQTYKNYELIIVNDGSTDNSDDIIKKYIKQHKLENKFIYHYEENADQLNALKKASEYITGDYVYILHSDDIFDDNLVLSKIVAECNDNPEVDAFIPRYLPIINKDGIQTKIQKVREFKKNKNYIKELILSGGNNLFIDTAFVKTALFLTNVFYNYLTWNRPFWADIEKGKSLLLKTVEFPFFKYRVFEENYINTELGMLNVYNGVLRTFVDATEQYNFPFFKLQRLLYKICLKLKNADLMHAFFIKRPTKNKFKSIKSILPKQICQFPYYKSILDFYKNNKNDRAIELKDLPEKIFVGSDIRIFNKLILQNNLPEFYNNFMKEMEMGFGKVIIDKKDKDKVEKLLHFFCIKNVVITQNEDL